MSLIEHEPFCTGHVCVNCCICEECHRAVGTPHLDACACPGPAPLHWLCGACLSARVADTFVPLNDGDPDWRARRRAAVEQMP